MIRETEHNLYGPIQPDLVSMARIKDAASLKPPSRLINQELQDESTDESAGYQPRLATIKVLFVNDKLRLAFVDHLSFLTIICVNKIWTKKIRQKRHF